MGDAASTISIQAFRYDPDRQQESIMYPGS